MSTYHGGMILTDPRNGQKWLLKDQYRGGFMAELVNGVHVKGDLATIAMRYDLIDELELITSTVHPGQRVRYEDYFLGERKTWVGICVGMVWSLNRWRAHVNFVGENSDYNGNFEMVDTMYLLPA